MSKPVLTYFAGRGLAEVIRLILAQAAVDYEDRRVADIAALKPTLAYGSVPLWEENGFRLVQSAAIARYLARTHGLYGKTVQESALIDQLIEGLSDTRQAITTASKGDEATKASITKEIIPKWFGFLDKLLSHSQSGWAVGDQVSWGDLALFNVLDNTNNGYPGSLDHYAHLKASHKKVAELPHIAKWLANRPKTEW